MIYKKYNFIKLEKDTKKQLILQIKQLTSV